jgi:signal transduction histidine kinase
MFSTLRSRLWLTYALLVTAALAVVALVFFVYLLANPLVYRQALGRIDAVQRYMLARQASWSSLPADELQSELAQVDQVFDVRLLVLADRQTILADSRQANATPLILRRLQRLLKINQVLRDESGQAWVYNVRQLDNGNYLLTAIQRPRFSIFNAISDELLPPIWLGGIVALILALAVAYLMARWVADPLQRMVTTASQFPSGEACELPLEGPHEVQEVLRAFNQMTARVQASQQSQRDFVANVSHELKTPLTSIQGFSQAILDGTADTPEAQKQAAQVIHAESGRMYRLVLDLLDLARLDAGIASLERAPVEMEALLTGVVQRMAPQAQAAGVTLELDPAPLPVISGDGDRLAQVFNNLVDNALKFTPPGGKVSIAPRLLPGAIEISVSDTGPGIPQAALEHIFDRFYQVDPSRSGGAKRGSGLGLSIAREIIRAHNGKISGRSVEGQGSQFIVWLPTPDTRK